jgi:nitrogen regulatory protein PII
MKRIEAFFQFGKLETLVEAVEEAGAEGVTVFYARGRGSAERLPLQSRRGTEMRIPLFNIVDSIVTIVDDTLVEPVINAIRHASFGSKGIIVVSDVSQIIRV